LLVEEAVQKLTDSLKEEEDCIEYPEKPGKKLTKDEKKKVRDKFESSRYEETKKSDPD